MSDKKTMQENNDNKGNTEKLEERALSVFSSERNEDLTALVLCLVTTFSVLLFTKWLV
ncbi:hypothetical protein [Desulfosediminicola flagellatus]|uniref:hypothetical protein n=1 Tax=Desulfosediminicola flagellatus TaxID=2569541 RepID=UPI00142F20E0|nr:hypothetical protein [Desulfosediminicola flagellatus]